MRRFTGDYFRAESVLPSAINHTPDRSAEPVRQNEPNPLLRCLFAININFVPMINYISVIVFSLVINAGLNAQINSFYDFRAEDIDGKLVELSAFKGKKVMVVNVASKCGLTPQYKQLQELYEKYGGKDFEIVAFPANNFMEQEPGSNSEIKSFCSSNYGVSFTMMSKISVKGDDMHPVYKWLTQKSKNGVLDSGVSWNFQKYLIDEQGRLVEMVPPRTSPLDEKITAWIEGR